MRYDNMFDLMEEADALGIRVEEDVLPHPLLGLSLSLDCGDYILLQRHMQAGRRRETLAHELGHFQTGLIDLLQHERWRGFCEHRAKVWATLRLMPPSELIRAFERGARTPREFAKALGLSAQGFVKGLAVCRQRFGRTLHLEAYTIRFQPFEIRPRGA